MRSVSLSTYAPSQSLYLRAESIPDAEVGVGCGYRLVNPPPFDTGYPVHSIPGAGVGVGFGYRFRKLSPVRYRAPGWGSGLGIDSASSRPFDTGRRGGGRDWVSTRLAPAHSIPKGEACDGMGYRMGGGEGWADERALGE